jgi:hypothetical protein
MKRLQETKWRLVLGLGLLLSISMVIWALWKACFFFLVFSSIFFTYIGFLGGQWLWDKVESSKPLKLLPYILIVGIIGIIACLLFAIMGNFMFFLGNDSLVKTYIKRYTFIMMIGTFYNLGYVISIWNVKTPKEYTLTKRFSLNKKLCFIIATLILFYIIVILAISYLLSIVHIINFKCAFKYLLCGIGSFVGWIVWEHLKKVIHFDPEFYKWLRSLSVGFLLIIGTFSVLGIIGLSKDNIPFLRWISLLYSLLSYTLLGYFVGLVYEIFKIKHVEKGLTREIR